MKIGIQTRDLHLSRKIQLSLEGRAEVEATDSASGVFDLLIIDCRGEKLSGDIPHAAIRMTDRDTAGDGELPYPFSYDELLQIIDGCKDEVGARLVLEPDREHVMLDGERIHLTEVEGKLLGAILGGNGEYVSRDRLIDEVWHGSAAEGALNVYIHYLREKLEKRGEKIILSSRKCGYKIDTKYTGGNTNAQTV